MAPSLTRNVVVIGASEGGLAALRELVHGLPADIDAALFVAMHLYPHRESPLPEMLTRRGSPRAHHPLHGEPIERGVVYVAPPDNHLLVRRGHVEVSRGPKENGFRPSVDALFRSAARAYGPRVIAVVLTGNLDCGTAGLLSVKARGGVAVVQDPTDAQVEEMPRSALEHVEVDYTVPLAEMSALLCKLIEEPVRSSSGTVSLTIAELEGDEPAASAELVCPQCNGVLTETDINGLGWYRCHVGHTFSSRSIIEQQDQEVERSLWAAVRALEESAALARRVASKSNGELRKRFEEREVTELRNADVVRELLLSPAGAVPRSARPERELESS